MPLEQALPFQADLAPKGQGQNNFPIYDYWNMKRDAWIHVSRMVGEFISSSFLRDDSGDQYNLRNNSFD